MSRRYRSAASEGPLTLAFQIEADGGVRIEGRADDLRELAAWLLRAAERGVAEPAYMTDVGLTSIRIARVG